MSASDTTAADALDVVPYPSALLARYRREGVIGTLSIADELRRVAAAHPGRPALKTEGLELAYDELDRRADQIAVGLRDLGLRPGERVLFQLTNTPWAVLAWYGVLKAGLVPVATLALHRRHEIEQISRQCEPAAHLVQADFPGYDLVAFGREMAELLPSLRVLLTVGGDGSPEGATALETLVDPASDADAGARAAVDAIQAQLSPDGLAVLQLSGGTTNVPKLIPRLHAEYWYNARAYADAIELDGDGCVAHAMPVIHNAGIVCGVHAAHAVGGCFAMSGPRVEQLRPIILDVAPTHMLLTRPLVDGIFADPEMAAAFARTRVIIWASGKLPGDVAAAFETPSSRIIQMFGMGEGLCLVTPVSAPEAVRHNTVGTFISARDEIRVYHPGTEELVEPGTQGELCARGPYTIRGYYKAPERNAVAFTPDGFYRTGDIVVEVDVEVPGRYFALEDRVKDLINRGGEKINAMEIEQLLQRHPAIEMAALVAMPDERLGERACAFVVGRPGSEAPTLDDIRVFFDQLGVAKFKWPERIEVRAELPLTNIMKLNKAKLRSEIAELVAKERA